MSGEKIIRTTTFPWLCEVTDRPAIVGAVACLCRGCRGAALEAENARLRAEIDGVDLAFEGLEETERGRRIGQWIGEAADATTRASELEARNARLRIALHDAIRRPLGVMPDSAAEFYDQRMAEEAEARRPRWSDRFVAAPPGILIAAEQERPAIPAGKTRVAKALRAHPSAPAPDTEQEV